MTVEGKVIVVTGAARGIGRAIAIAAAQAGARVAILDNGSTRDGAGLDAGMAEEVAETIKSSGGEGVALAADVADVDQARGAIGEVLSRWGRVDGLVNNAGIIVRDEFLDLDPADFERQVRVNLYGAFNMAHAVAPHFKAQESGAFVHMTSSVGLIGERAMAGYAASRFGVTGLSRSLSFDMAKFNVRSNCIAPSAATRMTELAGDSPEAQAYIARVKQISTPERIAPLALFLLGDASQEVTGQIFGCRGDTIYLYNQPRPIRIAQRGRGWTAETIARDILPGWEAALTPLETTANVFPFPEMAE